MYVSISKVPSLWQMHHLNWFVLLKSTTSLSSCRFDSQQKNFIWYFWQLYNDGPSYYVKHYDFYSVKLLNNYFYHTKNPIHLTLTDVHSHPITARAFVSFALYSTGSEDDKLYKWNTGQQIPILTFVVMEITVSEEIKMQEIFEAILW